MLLLGGGGKTGILIALHFFVGICSSSEGVASNWLVIISIIGELGVCAGVCMCASAGLLCTVTAVSITAHSSHHERCRALEAPELECR